jgi:hypothetical protein
MLQLMPSFSAIEQHEGSEMRQLDSLLKNQRRFHAAIGKKNAAVALWQGVSVLGHFNISANWGPRYVSAASKRSGDVGAS